ncbi:MAG: prepilin-type N-terminal cleavage/methylation domain-containing protein [Alphaproteobacteria bacterium]|nr:prepilin-type N-terminal cleavage/methylation domain-containing protein [Alphaproteobacteria bacterium]
MNAKFSGFSLIEMAFVLIIIGLVAGMTLPALKGMLDWQKATITTQNQEKILYALASYALQNKILPYAASPHSSRGIQDTEMKRRRGIIPYHDLGLPEAIAKDGYQRWFTYVVDDYYAVTPQLTAQIPSSIYPTPLRLCEKHTHLNSLNIKGLQTNVALVLISHGPQGRGAYPNPLSVPTQSSDEHQNATSENEIIDRPLSTNPNNPFSHKVLWITSKNLLALYGHAPCPSLVDVPQPSKNIFQPPQFPSQRDTLPKNTY